MKHILHALLLLCLYFSAIGQGSSPSGSAIIYGEIYSEQPIDTIELTVWQRLLDPYSKIPFPQKELIITKSGSIFNGAPGVKTFEVVIPVLTEGTRISFEKGRDTCIDKFLVEPGDTVRIRFNFAKGAIIFAGPAADKFRLQHALALLIEAGKFSQDPIMFTSDSSSFFAETSYMDLYKEAQGSPVGRKLVFLQEKDRQLEYIAETFRHNPLKNSGKSLLLSYRQLLDSKYVEVMKADLAGKILLRKVKRYNRLLKDDRQILNIYYKWIEPLPEADYAAQEAILRSPDYQDYLLTKSIIRSRIEKRGIISVINEKYTGDLRDVLITKYLIQYHRFLSDLDVQLAQALEMVELTWARDIVHSLYQSMAEGSPLKNTALTTLSGKEINTSEFKGKTLLLTFWLPGCKFCMGTYKNIIKPVGQHFRDKDDFRILFIASDEKMDRWRKNVDSGQYSDPHGVNLNTKGSAHPLLKAYNIHSFPYHILVDSQGKIARTSAFPATAEEFIDLINSVMGRKSETN